LEKTHNHFAVAHNGAPIVFRGRYFIRLVLARFLRDFYLIFMKFHRGIGTVLTSLVIFFTAATVNAQRQMETLSRGVVALRTSSTAVYVGWRLFGTDPDDVGFNLYRVAGTTTNRVNSSTITNSCNYVDTGATLTLTNSWFVRPVTNSVEGAASTAFVMPSNSPVQNYLSIPMQVPAGGTTPDGTKYTYSANDCSVGDLDGDGEYEIVVKWDPSNSKDNSLSGYTGDVYLDAYKLNGTRLWRIDLGKNIRAGAHYTQFQVYDLDGDGKAEVACKTAPGTVDGQTNYVIMSGDNPAADYRNSSGYILSGPEYLTIFNGQTGAAMVTTNYWPPRGTVSNWGDSYGNRVDRFLACVAYLDGVRPSLVMCRGYYTRAVLAAWDWRNGQLTQRWVFDTTNGYSAYEDQGNHNLAVGDVDGDGKDEIVYGACAIDHDGTGLYSTGWGHGDAMHMSDMDPNHPGLEVWDVHENYPNATCGGGEYRAAGTGKLLWGYPGTSDTGRGMAAPISTTNTGYILWSSATSGAYDTTGTKIFSSKPSSDNFAVWWDADLARELLDGSDNDDGVTNAPYIAKWTGSGSATLLSATGCYANNSTKATPCLTADILGDWREEAIWRNTNSTELRIYVSTIVATNRLYTLMHDPQYRVAIAWQNTAYNQPPDPGFYLGPGMVQPPRPPVSDANLAWRGGNGNAWDITTASNWFINGIWTNDVATIFAQGNSVLFDLRGVTNPSVNLAAALGPSKVTVFSPSNFTFAGSGALTGAMAFYKVGSGRLTVNNTNTYTGGTFVSGGTMFINGGLPGSAVTLENREAVAGPARIGGVGVLGKGLTVQKGGIVIVGPDTNSAGTLTVSNTFTELGAVSNLFDLSSDPTGTTNANDRVNIIGNLVLSGINTIAINQPNGWLGNGVYPLLQYSGTLTGGLTNLVLSGNFVQTVALTNPAGMIALLAIVPSSVPVAPSELTATAISPSQILLLWTDNSTNETAFVIERSNNNTDFATTASVSAGVTRFLDSGLAASTTYYYRVRGTNMIGASGDSSTANATTPTAPLSLIWHGDGAVNSWDILTTTNWLNGATAAYYIDGASVTFDDSGSNSPAISLATNLQPGSVTVAATHNYTLGGSGALVGTMTLVKSGSGTLTITNANSFTGGVNLTAGTVALGNTAGVGVGPLMFNGGTISFNVSSQQTYTNDLDVDGTGTIISAGGYNNIVNGDWSGTSTLNISMTSGTFSVGGDMSGFSGSVVLGSSAGTFRFYGSTGSVNTIFDLGNGTATLNNRNGTTIALGALTGGIGTFVSGAGSANAASIYIVGGKNLDTTFAGTIMDANLSRITCITKTGTGTWTLTGANTYTGTTTVSAGTLLVNGNQSPATGAVSVASGAILGGAGILGGAVTVNSGGAMAPGSGGAGTLTISNSLALDSDAILNFELGATNASDKVAVSGALVLGGTLNVTGLTGFGTNTYTLFTCGGALSGTLPVIGTMPSGYSGTLSTNASGQVKLAVQAVTPPIFGGIGVTNGSLTLSGSGGTANGTYYVLASTNVALPLAQWQFIATNQFDTNGNFTVTGLACTNAPQRFYLLQLQ
jgi:rhamnogalacturonan endolyase